MNAGLYKHKITIQVHNVEADEISFQGEEWTDHVNDFAYVNGISGREYWDAAVVNAENTVDFTLRWKPYLDKINTTDYRIAFNGRFYNINTIDNYRFENKTVKLRGVETNG